MKPFMAVVITVTLAGCAGTYKPTDTFTQHINSMSEAQAKTSFYSIVLPSQKSIGLCDFGPYRVDKGVKPIKAQNGIAFRAWKHGDYLRDEEKDGKQYKVYQKDYYVQKVKFSDIKKVRILRNRRCYGGKGVHTVTLYVSSASYMEVDVPKNKLDKFLASIKVLQPDARMMEGVGL